MTGARWRTVALPRADDGAGTCADCGAGSYVDGYCAACGMARPEPDRDEVSLDAIALITDRGLVKSGNEDAAAVGISETAVATAVCDGVSSSVGARRAASAASCAGVDAMLAALAESPTPREAVLAGLAAGYAAAADAGAKGTPDTAPSCTYTAAVVVPSADGFADITVGNVGDSRSYWLPSAPGVPVQLTVDDTMARKLIDAGASPDSPEVRRVAHVLTRWFGGGAEAEPWTESSVDTIRVDGDGLLLVCTDGLWNYFPEPADLAAICTGASTVEIARTLVDRALEAGGHDNVTVALIPIGAAHEFD